MRYVLKTNHGYFASTGWSNLRYSKNYTDNILKATLYKSPAAIKGIVSHAYRRFEVYTICSNIYNNIDWNSIHIIYVEITAVSEEKFTPKDK